MTGAKMEWGEALDKIAALEARVAELEAALKPFADGASIIEGLAAGSPATSNMRNPSEWTEEYGYNALAAARAALNGGPDD